MDSGWSILTAVLLAVLIMAAKHRYQSKCCLYDSYRVSVAIEGGVVVSSWLLAFLLLPPVWALPTILLVSGVVLYPSYRLKTRRHREGGS